MNQADNKTAQFRFPGGDARTTIIGATGSGKSTCGLWMLAHQRLDVRPWVIFDFKRESFFDRVGFPPITHIGVRAAAPKKPGLYLVSPLPGQDDEVEALLWRIWQQENCGLYIDEAPLMPQHGDAFQACIQQGRSKHIPIIACAQRPVGVPRGLFSEANFVCLYTLTDRRDFKLVEGFVPSEMSAPLPWHYWRWWDRERRALLAMKPVPPPATVAAMLSVAAPYKPNAWHPFTWSSRKSQNREPARLN